MLKKSMQTKSDVPQFGWCGHPEQAVLMQRAGVDYFEGQLAPMQLEDDSAFANAKAQIRDLALPARAFNMLFPASLKIVGPEKDIRRNRNYFDRVAVLLAIAKTDILVLGSGASRNIPAGWTVEQAEADFLATLTWCTEGLQGLETTLVIEPLNRKESSLINSISDGVRLAKIFNHPQVRALADFFHMDQESEALDVLSRDTDWLAHIHLADTGRQNPGTGSYDYGSFFRNIKQGGFCGRLSVEGHIKGDPLIAMRESLNFLRHAWLHSHA
jgi:sugar phosphate isomerase/epimerase